MKFLIVTPSLNRIDFLDATIASVVSQAGDFEIEYIVQDGGSNHPVIELLKNWKQRIDSGDFKPPCKKLVFRYFVEADENMYEAINKGFAVGSGDVMAWLNTDDAYLPHAFATVQEIFSRYKDTDWLIGTSTCINSAGAVTSVNPRNLGISRYFVQRGYYRADIPFFDWLPQESIFWRASLWKKAGPLSTQYRLVSDFKLWQSFAKHTTPTKCESLLGAFRYHEKQMTNAPDAYPNELGEAPVIPFGLRFLCALSWLTPRLSRLLACLPLKRLFLACLGLKKEQITGEVVHWDFEGQKWVNSEKSAV